VRRGLALGALLLALGCNRVTGPAGVKLGEEFELRVGQTGLVDDELLALSFEDVPQDSRCPIDAICVWEGDAVVRVTARRLPRSQARLELHTQPDRSQAAFQTYRIRLVTLSPRPRASQPVPQREYAARLVVTRP
jgi:hypothetical protein